MYYQEFEFVKIKEVIFYKAIDTSLISNKQLLYLISGL